MGDAGASLESLTIPVAAATAIGHVRDELRAAAGDNLVSLVLYGGLARGRHRGARSDADIAIVLEDAAPDRVRDLAPVLLAAWRAARVEPWILARSELPRLAEVFPTRMLDIAEHHVVLSGEDVFAGLPVERHHLRLRVEQELSNLSLRLRRGLVTLADDPASMAVQLAGVARPLAIQLSALLRLSGRDLPAEDRSAAVFAEAAVAFGLDAGTLAELAALRGGEGEGGNVADLFAGVQAAATRAAEVAAALEVPAGGGR